MVHRCFRIVFGLMLIHLAAASSISAQLGAVDGYVRVEMEKRQIPGLALVVVLTNLGRRVGATGVNAWGLTTEIAGYYVPGLRLGWSREQTGSSGDGSGRGVAHLSDRSYGIVPAVPVSIRGGTRVRAYSPIQTVP